MEEYLDITDEVTRVAPPPEKSLFLTFLSQGSKEPLVRG